MRKRSRVPVTLWLVSAIEKLRARIAELSDLDAVHSLLVWDQRVMMPPEGAAGTRAAAGTLARIAHKRGTAEEIGSWLAELDGIPLDELNHDIVRIARRDWERARRVPEDLAGELARAHAEGRRVGGSHESTTISTLLRRLSRVTSSWHVLTVSVSRATEQVRMTDCWTTMTSGYAPRICNGYSANSPRRCRHWWPMPNALAAPRAAGAQSREAGSCQWCTEPARGRVRKLAGRRVRPSV